jgi:hypothetical protein
MFKNEKEITMTEKKQSVETTAKSIRQVLDCSFVEYSEDLIPRDGSAWETDNVIGEKI